MEKFSSREWVASLEEMADNKLKKWQKGSRIENGEALQRHWQFEQTHLLLDIFWEDHKETVVLHYSSPRVKKTFTWHGLDNKTFNHAQDRLGHLSMITMHPPIDPEFDE